ncbi:helix-turn-helix transcriptional regulator [Naumannella sp. ID2617S]|nr:helix-turn-helix transcriptional regulator [Naumannella sp. ID2617S]
MTGAVRAVHPALRGLLAGPMVGYDLRTDPRAVHFGLPAPAATVILAFEEPIDVGWADTPGESAKHWQMVSGMHTRPALVHTHGTQCGIQLSLTPLGFRLILDAPIGALANEVAGLDELGVPSALHARLADEPSWDRRLALLEEELLRRAVDERASQPGDEVAQAWRLLRRTGARVDEVAGSVGWSRRHLTNRCVAEFGVAPKQVIRLARFDRSRQAVRSGLTLADAAYRFGFSDQSHLTREWVQLAGRTPSQTLAEEFPILQD